jgi:hypothetical protein
MNLRIRSADLAAPGLRRGATMPDGFTLTICYGESSLLPRVLGWARRIRQTSSYFLGLESDERVVDGLESVGGGLVRIGGGILCQVIERLLADASPPKWPFNLLWLEEELREGVVFDEYAGTPQDPPGADDKRIFEVACW